MDIAKIDKIRQLQKECKSDCNGKSRAERYRIQSEVSNKIEAIKNELTDEELAFLSVY